MVAVLLYVGFDGTDAYNLSLPWGFECDVFSFHGSMNSFERLRLFRLEQQKEGVVFKAFEACFPPLIPDCILPQLGSWTHGVGGQQTLMQAMLQGVKPRFPLAETNMGSSPGRGCKHAKSSIQFLDCDLGFWLCIYIYILYYTVYFIYIYIHTHLTIVNQGSGWV